MAQDTNAAYQMAIWDLAESVRLEEQTLSKLARALPALLGVPNTANTNELTGLLRPLLTDLVHAESFVEVRAAVERPASLFLGIKLSPERAALWQTNINVLAEASSRSNAATISITNVGNWVIVGFGAQSNADFAGFLSRCNTNQPVSTVVEPWIVADIDLGWWVKSNAVFLRQDLPTVHFTLSGDGQNVRTRADLMFSKPLGFELPPWQTPTNLIHDPLMSFTALRGATKWFTRLTERIGVDLNSPSQFFTWSMAGIPLQTYLAIPDSAASKRVDQLAADLHERTRQYIATNTFGRLERTTNGGLIWMDFPFLPASLETAQVPSGSFLVAGWSPLIHRNNRATPPELLAQFLPRTNLVYYDWELTETRLDAWTYLAQTLRLTTRHAQLPPDCGGQQWLRAIAGKLGNCVTAVERVGDSKLVLARTSGIGLTAVELHLLVDWLESPDFPNGVHSVSSKPDSRLYRTSPPPESLPSSGGKF